ncbi:hypothetical protein DS745_05740 [Anaerobacillus alkaliphilus]|uniref:Regulatory protein YycH domain-containing protein n=1 Tax=Anaerobacillus alkaliphilus TaxID=1548597 RepID=A0A4Q0VWZ2_9BACI|nr:two-component system activity regulator YycH [Anaerobacillus alkaliphilus]RXJ02811.1 hypothetical protein DS745_05740 [Anaerobacillus alkaliphilus]
MVEHIKTTTLWFLILLSVFLTYQIWTFQPEYAILKSTEYIDNTQIGLEKKLHEVIKPKQVILHEEGKSFASIDNSVFAQRFYEEYFGTPLEKFMIRPNLSPFHRINSDYKIEFIFPTSIPSEIFKDIYQMNHSDQLFISKIDRMVFALEKERDKEIVRVKLISNDERVIVEANTNIPVSRFIEDIALNSTNVFYEVFPFDIIDFGNGYRKTTYLPIEAMYLNSATYIAKPLPTDHFRQVLFSDPNFVKHYLQSNGEESFTDGNRMVNILQGGNILRYINPTFGDLVERNNKHVIFSALDFLNGHGGFTSSFYFDSLKTFGTSEEVTFRLFIGGLPVYSTNIFEVNNLFEITLHRGNGNQIEQYVRPMFIMDEEPINISKSTRLPSGKELIEALENKEEFERSLLTDINYGFTMIMRQSFVVLEPRWFIQYNGNWQVVHIAEEVDDSEAITNGLE